MADNIDTIRREMRKWLVDEGLERAPRGQSNPPPDQVSPTPTPKSGVDPNTSADTSQPGPTPSATPRTERRDPLSSSKDEEPREGVPELTPIGDGTMLELEAAYPGRKCPKCGGSRLWSHGSRDYKGSTAIQYECREVTCKNFKKRFWVNDDLHIPLPPEVIKKSGIAKLSDKIPPKYAFRLYDGYFSLGESIPDLLRFLKERGVVVDQRTLQSALANVARLYWEEFMLDSAVHSIIGYSSGSKVLRYLLVDVTPYVYHGKTLYLYLAMDHTSGLIVNCLLSQESEYSERGRELLKELLQDLREWGYTPDVVVSDQSDAIIKAVEATFPSPRTVHQFDHTHYIRAVKEAIFSKKRDEDGNAFDRWTLMSRRRYGRWFMMVMDITNPTEFKQELQRIAESKSAWAGDKDLKRLGERLLENREHWAYFQDHERYPKCPHSSGKVEGYFSHLDKKEDKSKTRSSHMWSGEVLGWIIKNNRKLRRNLLDRERAKARG